MAARLGRRVAILRPRRPHRGGLFAYIQCAEPLPRAEASFGKSGGGVWRIAVLSQRLVRVGPSQSSICRGALTSLPRRAANVACGSLAGRTLAGQVRTARSYA